MIIPNKYIKPSESIMYLSTIIIKQIGNKKYNVVDLWLEIKANNNITYNKYLQILIYLNIIGAINYNKKGEIYNENIRSSNIFS